MGEHLFHNGQILRNGRPLHPDGFPLCMYRRITLLHHLRGLAQQDRQFEGQLAQELQAIVDALPPTWLQAVQGPKPPSNEAWIATTDPNIVVRIKSSQASTSQEVHAFTRLSTGRLEPLEYLPFYRMPHLQPVSVVLWNPGRPWHKLAKPRSPQSGVNEAFYVNHAAPFHQYTWGFGAMRSHCYTVKQGTARACTLQAVKHCGRLSFAPGSACKPAVWQQNTDQPPALLTQEKTWVQALATGRVPLAESALGKREAAQAPSWQFPSPPRPGPGQRRVPLPLDVPPEPRASDYVDYGAPSETVPSWAPVWRRLHTSGIQRQHRVIIWKLMHGALQSKAYMAYVALRARPRDPIPQFCCPHPGCDKVPDTITHQVFDCPVAKASLLWLTAMWPAITQSAEPPPMSFAVLVADDHRVRKPRAHLKLWQRLRVTTLYAIWNASKLARGGAATDRGRHCRLCDAHTHQGNPAGLVPGSGRARWGPSSLDSWPNHVGMAPGPVGPYV